MSVGPAYRISDFFSSLGRINNVDDFNKFCANYWYVIFIICLIIVAMILLNLALIIFFLQRTRSLKKIVKRLPNQEKFSKRVIIPERVETKPVENLQDTESKFAMEAFMANNKYRAIHNAPPLRLNAEITQKAQQIAEYLAKTRKFQHSSVQQRIFTIRNPANGAVIRKLRLGENLAKVQQEDLTGHMMMEMWYGERVNHDFTVNKLQRNSENFSQMVWKDSLEVGYGRAKSSNGFTYGVALYGPEGNMDGKFIANVSNAENIV